jgi:hypothetical protein
MSELTARGLVDLLARNELRIRTGILELPIDALGNESNLAVNLGIGCHDVCTWKLNRTPADRTHLAISWQSLTEDLASLLSDLSAPGYCVWASGIDVMLAAISFEERKQFWAFLRTTFRQSRGLLVSMPRMAAHLLPDDERTLWTQYGRLAGWTNDAGEARTPTT